VNVGFLAEVLCGLKDWESSELHPKIQLIPVGIALETPEDVLLGIH